jgi:hypothetical protein
MASAPRPSASGAGVGRRTASTIPLAPISCRGRPARRSAPWSAALRKATGFPLDDLTFVVRHFLPHLDRDNVHRILKAEGLSRRPPAERPEKKVGAFKDHELGFVHVDIKRLPKLRTADGEVKKRYLHVAIDRRSRWVHLAVQDDETEASATAFLKEALAAFPFQVTHLLTDRGSCFTADRFEDVCRELGVEHRKTKPCTPKTNGLSAAPTSLRGIGLRPMVERFNGRVQREVLGITAAGHRDLELLLVGFNQAYNARRQRVLDGRSPGEVVRERLECCKDLANPDHRAVTGRQAIGTARRIVEAAKEVSQPDRWGVARHR